MSATHEAKRLTICDLAAMKGKTPIVSLTAYTAPIAKLLDAHVDLFIVGDSVNMVLYGNKSTLGVSVETMLRHGKTVVEHSQRACVLVDMPFGSYQQSPAQAFENCARVLGETGADTVKLEGGTELVQTVEFLTKRGIAVMAHIGLKPQHVQAQGGYCIQGRGADGRALMLEEAKQFEQAGAWGLLLEGTIEEVAAEITRSVAIPTIGIGASAQCDGQVLVTDDMLGMFETTPRFVKQYATLREVIDKAVGTYAKDVRARKFPAAEHTVSEKKNPKLVKKTS